MTRKGLFDSLFIVIMLLFMTPSVLLPSPSINVVDGYNQLTLFTLAVDDLVEDTFKEVTNNNSCEIDTIENYRHQIYQKINIDLSNILKKNINLNCNAKIDQSNINLSGVSENNATLQGNIFLECFKKDSFSDIKLQKNLSFNKTLQIIEKDPCQINVVDNLN